MTPYDYCTRGTIKIRIFSGEDIRVRSIPAWCYGDFAAHKTRWGDEWQISHIPTGLCLSNSCGVFRSADEAVAAMIEVQKLRNDWAVFDAARSEDFMETRKALEIIGAAFCGHRTMTAEWKPVRADLREAVA